MVEDVVEAAIMRRRWESLATMTAGYGAT
jgi:hypothetical protein